MPLGGRWNISLFHYRNHGADFGRVLAAFEVPDAERAPSRRSCPGSAIAISSKRATTPTGASSDRRAYMQIGSTDIDSFRRTSPDA